MKIWEIISEDTKPISQSLKNAVSNLTTYDSLDNNNNPYLAYRFGVALASSPDSNGYAEGPTGSKFVMTDYSDADAEIRKGAERKLGVAPSSSTGKGSEELPEVNKRSVVTPSRKNKYGV